MQVALIANIISKKNTFNTQKSASPLIASALKLLRKTSKWLSWHSWNDLFWNWDFLERQKRISIDGTDYYIDLLFYHRKLNRLIAIDLKLGKFKPEHKGQIELYLKYLQHYEMQSHENMPFGLLHLFGG